MARHQYKEVQKQKEERKFKMIDNQKQRELKIKERKAKNLKRNKIFTQKTKKGQPLMRARMDHLLAELNEKYPAKS